MDDAQFSMISSVKRFYMNIYPFLCLLGANLSFSFAFCLIQLKSCNPGKDISLCFE